jgi:hypothetical protein
MPAVKWEFEADYYTWCNCAWGCPCNFNARPTEGHCHGAGVWSVRRGRFGKTALDGAKFADLYWFPGLVEQGNGRTRLYLDRATSQEQRKALIAIESGKVGGGVFEVFPKLASKRYPPMVTDIEFTLKGTQAHVKVGDVMEAESEGLSYPDGMKIFPEIALPHGIEFKTGLATNTKKWWIRDEDMLASHENVYGVVATVKFTEKGCVG